MRYLLDTCFLSDLAKAVVPAGVEAWARTNDAGECGISTITIGELRHGIEILPEGRRRSELREWMARDILQRFSDRTLDVTVEIAEAWASLSARASRSHRQLPAADGLILATATIYRLTVVTRNVRDFSGYDVPIVNPWDGSAE